MHESHALNRQALQFDRLRPIPVWREAVKLWILGRDDEAVRAVSVARDRMEMDSLAWQAALVVYAFTGDYAAADRLLEQPGEMMSQQGRDAWRKSLLALEHPTPAHISAARAAMEQVSIRPVMASHAIMVLSSLGDIDTAFRLFESRGFLPSLRVTEGTTYENAASRWHQWLFCPAARNLHTHAGFERACERLGLAEYWRSRGELPDVPLAWLPLKPNA